VPADQKVDYLELPARDLDDLTTGRLVTEKLTGAFAGPMPTPQRKTVPP